MGPIPLQYNPEGGDLGRGTGPISCFELISAAPHVARVLSGAYEMGLRHIKYAFEIHMFDAKRAVMAAEAVDDYIKDNRIPHVNVYSTPDGKKIFDLRGPGGGVVAGKIMYLVTD